MQIDPRHDILGLIDVQPTFMPGGELPVTDGDAVLPVINRLLRRFGTRSRRRTGIRLATRPLPARTPDGSHTRR